jgi:hypothetical protein
MAENNVVKKMSSVAIFGYLGLYSTFLLAFTDVPVTPCLG